MPAPDLKTREALFAELEVTLGIAFLDRPVEESFKALLAEAGLGEAQAFSGPDLQRIGQVLNHWSDLQAQQALALMVDLPET